MGLAEVTKVGHHNNCLLHLIKETTVNEYKSSLSFPQGTLRNVAFVSAVDVKAKTMGNLFASKADTKANVSR